MTIFIGPRRYYATTLSHPYSLGLIDIMQPHTQSLKDALWKIPGADEMPYRSLYLCVLMTTHSLGQLFSNLHGPHPVASCTVLMKYLKWYRELL